VKQRDLVYLITFEEGFHPVLMGCAIFGSHRYSRSVGVGLCLF
jgi:hypothetical protein